MSETQRMFCPQCGREIFTRHTTEHDMCIKWGVNVRGYKGIQGWLEACIANGKRVSGTIPDEEALKISQPQQK